MGFNAIDRRALLMGAGVILTGCSQSAKSALAPNALHNPPAHTPYVLFPGDEIDVTFPSAPELSRQLILGPDGRVSLPIVGHVMAADKTLQTLEADVSNVFSTHLVRPAVEITLRRAVAGKVWIDGQVRTPGIFDIPAGPVDARQALILAGGSLPSARTSQIALIRRLENGQAETHILDLRDKNARLPEIQRGDILYVPRTSLGELTAFFTQVRDALPIGFSYALNGRWN